MEDNNGAGADRGVIRFDGSSRPTCTEDPTRMLGTVGPIGRGDIHVVDAHPDELPPVLTVPATIRVNATSPSGALVTFEPEVVCNPASGTTFPIVPSIR